MNGDKQKKNEINSGLFGPDEKTSWGMGRPMLGKTEPTIQRQVFCLCVPMDTMSDKGGFIMVALMLLAGCKLKANIS